MSESIREVRSDEVEILQDIAKRTFYHTFKSSYDDRDFNKFLEEAYNINQLSRELQEKDSFHYFFKDEQKVVGYLKLNINHAQTEKKGEDYLEIQRIYFDEAYQGGGRGKKFIDLAVKKAKEYHKTKIWLGVWEHNPQALRFYEKRGFVVTGAHEFYTGDVVDKDLIMEKSLI